MFVFQFFYHFVMFSWSLFICMQSFCINLSIFILLTVKNITELLAIFYFLCFCFFFGLILSSIAVVVLIASWLCWMISRNLLFVRILCNIFYGFKFCIFFPIKVTFRCNVNFIAC